MGELCALGLGKTVRNGAQERVVWSGPSLHRSLCENTQGLRLQGLAQDRLYRMGQQGDKVQPEGGDKDLNPLLGCKPQCSFGNGNAGSLPVESTLGVTSHRGGKMWPKRENMVLFLDVEISKKELQVCCCLVWFSKFEEAATIVKR